MRHWTEIEMWKDVTQEQFEDFHWQTQNRITTLEKLKKIINVTNEEERAIKEGLGEIFTMGITPYYALLMDPNDINDPIRRQAVPIIYELEKSPFDLEDPLAEDVDMPVPGIVHRYPDRVLFLVTDRCSVYCRHCTRSRMVSYRPTPWSQIEMGLEYIKKHKEIRDVVVSGGDSLSLSDEKIEKILQSLRSIDHVEIIRLGSRMPVTNPMRITEKLVNILKKYHPIYLNTHFNHPKEITKYSSRALNMLADGGVVLGNQTVLLRGVNDCPFVMKKLFQLLLKNRCRPYYIYQCDLTEGLEHFRTKVSKGIEIMEFLRGHTSGLAIPYFVVDAPGGGGKIPVMPNYVISMSDSRVILRNYEGKIFMYPEPKHADSPHDYRTCQYCQEMKDQLDGVAALLWEGNNSKVNLDYPSKRDLRRKNKEKIYEEIIQEMKQRSSCS
jgi:lysine 2,3-aminomutase